MRVYHNDAVAQRSLAGAKDLRFIDILPKSQKPTMFKPNNVARGTARSKNDDDETGLDSQSYPINKTDERGISKGSTDKYDILGIQRTDLREHPYQNESRESESSLKLGTTMLGRSTITTKSTNVVGEVLLDTSPSQTSKDLPMIKALPNPRGLGQFAFTSSDAKSTKSQNSQPSTGIAQSEAVQNSNSPNSHVSPYVSAQQLPSGKHLSPGILDKRSSVMTGAAQEMEEEVDWVEDESDLAVHKDAERLPTKYEAELPIARAISKTIHILGTGTVGRFIAHSLVRTTEAPPVVLLVHKPHLIRQWYDEGAAISLIKDGEIDSRRGLIVEPPLGLHTNISTTKISRPRNPQNKIARFNNIIETLIVTTDGATTISALIAIRSRLRSYSTICFIQDGLGLIDQVNAAVFPDPTKRPSYMLGSISHSLQSTGSPFTVLERRPGTLSLTILPQTAITGKTRRMDFGWTARARYLMRVLCRAPELQATGYLHHEFYKMQLERLAINAVIGPLSVAYNCTNDQLLYNYQISRTMKMLLKEISAILIPLAEGSRVSNTNDDFSPARLESLVVSVLGKTGENRTSMLQAVMDGRKTNIDFYNGYLLECAADLGIDCPCLEMIVALVKGKQGMESRRKNSYIPFQQ